uniref:Uncharacterized protein n=1 Tax=Panagrolaimus superbus TaxID=310955 RepID=A0A914Z4R0_9BILA
MKTPEVAQFKASQKLLNPNKAVGHPFDTIKVRLQTMPKPLPGQKPLFTGALDCVQQTIKHEGLRVSIFI